MASLECSALSWKSRRGQNLSAEEIVFVPRMPVASQCLHNNSSTELFAGICLIMLPPSLQCQLTHDDLNRSRDIVCSGNCDTCSNWFPAGGSGIWEWIYCGLSAGCSGIWEWLSFRICLLAVLVFGSGLVFMVCLLNLLVFESGLLFWVRRLVLLVIQSGLLLTPSFLWDSPLGPRDPSCLMCTSV